MNLIVSELGVIKSYVSRTVYYIMADLIRVYGWKHFETFDLWREPGSLKTKLLRRFGELPKVILFWGGYELLSAHEADLGTLESRKCAFVDDLHSWDELTKYRKHKGLSMCDLILGSCAYALGDFYPDLAQAKEVVWIPNSASPDFMLDYNEHPIDAILLSGAIHPVYPLRCKMKSLYDLQAYPIVFHPHPGYRCGYDYNIDPRVGRGYATKINWLRAAFADCSKYKYVVKKYFEIPATGSLLLADGGVSEQMAKLGFVEGVHYIAASSENLEEMIRYVLSERNRSEIDAIRRRGQELVLNRHKTADRARMIDEVCNRSSS
jgi:hypothetical protein